MTEEKPKTTFLSPSTDGSGHSQGNRNTFLRRLNLFTNNNKKVVLIMLFSMKLRKIFTTDLALTMISHYTSYIMYVFDRFMSSFQA